jgi:N6-adenosine-specific RNA methylase IME4
MTSSNKLIVSLSQKWSNRWGRKRKKSPKLEINLNLSHIFLTGDFEVINHGTREFHPVANIFPLLQGEDFEELKRDIAQNGLIQPIWLHPDGRIIDGRNRWRACLETNTTAHFEIWDEAKHGPLINFVLSLNLHRRHLDSSQRAVIAIEVLPILEEQARQRQLATLKQNQNTDVELFPHRVNGKARDQTAVLMQTNGRYIQDAKRLKEEAPDLFDKVKNGQLTIPQAKQEIARHHVPTPAITPPLPLGKYRCIVLDPPWPMKKIEREERPNQGIELDYPTMSLEEIAALPIPDLADENGCHLYVWVTQKYLPAGLELVKQWGYRYECLMTWRKNVGITPFSWMYDTEHVIFARCGNLSIQQLGLRLSFDAPACGHSVKPDVFFDERVLLASPQPRLEMFARKYREGFEGWGNEI